MKTIITMLILIAISTPALAAKSIVGKWGSDGEACGFSPVTVGAMSISSPELRCRFSSVSRAGDTVTWRGACDRAWGSRVPKAVVTATRQDDGMNERISLRVNGGVEHDIVRCR